MARAFSGAMYYNATGDCERERDGPLRRRDCFSSPGEPRARVYYRESHDQELDGCTQRDAIYREHDTTNYVRAKLTANLSLGHTSTRRAKSIT